MTAAEEQYKSPFILKNMDQSIFTKVLQIRPLCSKSAWADHPAAYSISPASDFLLCLVSTTNENVGALVFCYSHLIKLQIASEIGIKQPEFSYFSTNPAIEKPKPSAPISSVIISIPVDDSASKIAKSKIAIPSPIFFKAVPPI